MQVVLKNNAKMKITQVMLILKDLKYENSVDLKKNLYRMLQRI